MELECFAHGAMCIAYSGRCLMSAYLTGRSAQSGFCSHTCRWDYDLGTSSSQRLAELNKKGGKLTNILKRFYTLFFVIIGWVLFRSDSMGLAVTYLKSMFGLSNNGFADGVFVGWLTQNAVLIIIGTILSTPLFRFLSEKTKSSNTVGFIKVAALIGLHILSVASLVNDSYNPFIYFNF